MSAKDSVANTLRVALMVCLVCAVVVSTAAVVLRPAQEQNRLLFRQINILQAADMYTRGMDVQAAFESIDRRFVELSSGQYVERPETFDPLIAARDPAQSRALDKDPAGIRRLEEVAEVFHVRDEEGRLTRLVLPVRGYGLWSTMYGFLALERDLTTISGIRFYEHGETPGLGGEIENPRWQENWTGKRIFDDAGDLAIRVEKAAVPSDAPDAQHRIDGISGATITVRGVDNLLNFWLGDNGYGPYLERLREQLATGS